MWVSLPATQPARLDLKTVLKCSNGGHRPPLNVLRPEMRLPRSAQPARCNIKRVPKAVRAKYALNMLQATILDFFSGARLILCISQISRWASIHSHCCLVIPARNREAKPRKKASSMSTPTKQVRDPPVSSIVASAQSLVSTPKRRCHHDLLHTHDQKLLLD